MIITIVAIIFVVVMTILLWFSFRKRKVVMKQHDCKPLEVQKDCCYISFGKGKTDVSSHHFYTIRDEMMVMDLDKHGNVIGIELVNTKMKPCQRG